jgi:pyochelin synthetase
VITAPGAQASPFQMLSDIQRSYLVGREAPFLGGTSCYLCWEIEGRGWDIPRLEAAWNRMVARHEALRTVFTAGTMPTVLADVPHYSFQVFDLRDNVARLAELREEAMQADHDPARWPLFRIAVAILPHAMHLFFGIDLVVADGRSVMMLLRELGELYDDPSKEVRPPAAGLRDHLASLEARKSTAAHQEHVQYWTKRLDEIPPPPDLPSSGALIERSHFRRIDHRIPREQWEAIQQQAARRGLRKVSVLATALAEVLARWASRADLTLNVTVSRREAVHPEIEEAIGDFTTNVLLAVDCRERVPFAERVRAVKAQLARDLEHVDCGGVEVIGMLSRRRQESARYPVVFTSLLHRDASIRNLGRFRTGITRTPQVTLDAQIFDDGEGLYLSWDVVEEYFAEGTLAAMWESYCTFVERLATDDGAWDDEGRDLLPSAQRARRAEANATSVAVPQETLHERVLQQARRTPERIAVLAADRTLTYAEVVGRAAALARELREAGARQNELVGIILPKGWQQVVAVLGVQMSGAAYLPIEVSTPEARIAELLRLGEVRIAVAGDDIPLPFGVRRRQLSKAVADATAVQSPARPDDLAYVIFTSGSTGTPKGVMIRHCAAANTVRDINSRFSLGADDRVIALSSLSFDLSVWDLFGTLSSGGAIVIPEHDSARDPEYLARLVEEHGVTIWNSVPSYLQMLAEHAPDPRRLRTLRLAMLSGDWIPVSLPGRLPVPIVSLGGATEASIWSIAYPIGRVDPEWTSIPYGRPLANQQFHVLNERLEDCPDGVPGELYIGGDGLADGYWRDAERTAASFLVHPLKGRLYRTGDWGKYRADGEIEFLGRRDGQVKISGHRVELGEVEAALHRCAGVREAAAVTFTDEH